MRRGVSETEIRTWCIDHVAKLIDRSPAEIDPNATFSELGLDSATSVHLVIEIEDWLGIELIPEIVYDYPTIVALAEFLVRERV